MLFYDSKKSFFKVMKEAMNEFNLIITTRVNKKVTFLII